MRGGENGTRNLGREMQVTRETGRGIGECGKIGVLSRDGAEEEDEGAGVGDGGRNLPRGRSKVCGRDCRVAEAGCRAEEGGRDGDREIGGGGGGS